MSSLTRLRRRLLRWERYLDRVQSCVNHGDHRGRARSGYWRALYAVKFERSRRDVDAMFWPVAPYDRYWPAEAYDAHVRRLL